MKDRPEGGLFFCLLAGIFFSDPEKIHGPNQIPEK